MVRTLYAVDSLKIPKGITISVKNRVVTVKGPRGELTKDFRHTMYTFGVDLKNRQFRAEVFRGTQRDKACIKTCISHIRNLVVGVTKGFEYKMRFAYAHFPVNVTVSDDNVVEVRNFLGEKFVRRVPVPEGVTAVRTDQAKAKDELVLTGNDIDIVAGVCADIRQSCLVKRKDIRKFLDGIYVQHRGPIGSNA